MGTSQRPKNNPPTPHRFVLRPIPVQLVAELLTVSATPGVLWMIGYLLYGGVFRRGGTGVALRTPTAP